MSTAATQAPSHPQPGPEMNHTTADNTARNAEINNPPTSSNDAKGPNDAKGKGELGEVRDLGPDDEISSEQAQEAGLPEQKHAGKVGFGPDYANQTRATMGEKVQGFKEEIKGKLTKNPELVKTGHERRTGEIKQREHDASEQEAFNAGDEKKEQKPASESTPENTVKTENTSEPTKPSPAFATNGAAPSADAQPSATTKSHSGATTTSGPSATNTQPAAPSPGTKNTPTPYAAGTDGQGQKSGTGLGGGKSNDVDLNAGAARFTTDSDHPAAQDPAVQRAAN